MFPPKRTGLGGPWCCRQQHLAAATPRHSTISRQLSVLTNCLVSLWFTRQNPSLYFHVPFQDIAAEFWVGAQRSRKQRLVTIDGHAVLRENNYDINSVGALTLSLHAP